MDAAVLVASREACRRSTRQHASTFYFASHVLPAGKRRDAYAVYAFCRYVDDEIDLAPDERSRVEGIDRLQALLVEVYAPKLDAAITRRMPWLISFQGTVESCAIPQAYFQDLIAGVAMDCGRVRRTNWAELDRYCYHVAGVVGLIMVHVLGRPRPDLLGPAKDLGTAMQLTNILRDVREDWERDRLYLPAEELARFGVSEQAIAEHRCDDAFRALMRFQIERAREFYRRAQPGISELPGDGSRLTVALMSRIYGGILDEIERAEHNVFRGRVRVSLARKLWLACTA